MPHSLRKAVSHGKTLTHHSSPPRTSRPKSTLWEQFPQANRQRLLWLLSRLLERQLEPSSVLGKEGSDDCNTCAG